MKNRRSGKLRSFIISLWEHKYVCYSRQGRRWLKRQIARGLRRERNAEDFTP